MDNFIRQTTRMLLFAFFFFFLMKVNLNKKLGNLWYVSESVSHSCSCSCSVVSNSLWPRGLQPARPFCPWNFPGKKYWSGLPFTPQGNLPHPGIKPASPASSASPSLASRFLTLSHLYAFISRSVTFNSATPQTVAPLPGSSVHGFLHIRMLEWVAFPSGDLLDPGIEPGSPALQADSLPGMPPGKPT